MGTGGPGSGPSVPGEASPTGRAGFDPQAVNPLDWAILGAGVLAFLFSLFNYYKYTVKFGALSGSSSVSAWHGFFGWFSALLALVAAAVLALVLFAPQARLSFPPRLVVFGLFALALLCALLALLIVPGRVNTGTVAGTSISVNKGHGFGYWLSLLSILVGTVLSFLRLQQTGGSLPGINKRP